MCILYLQGSGADPGVDLRHVQSVLVKLAALYC